MKTLQTRFEQNQRSNVSDMAISMFSFSMSSYNRNQSSLVTATTANITLNLEKINKNEIGNAHPIISSSQRYNRKLISSQLIQS